MNLIKCAACQKEISPNAGKCPHCGEPIRKEGESKLLIPLLFVLVGVIIIALGNIHIVTGRDVGRQQVLATT